MGTALLSESTLIDRDKINIINFQKYITLALWLTFAALIVPLIWQDESPINSDFLSDAQENHPIEDVNVGHLYLSSPVRVGGVDGVDASSVDQNSKNNLRASDSVVDLGEPLDADVFNKPTQNEELPVNIGEPLDADSPLTDYTNETPVNLGGLMDADNPIYSINNDLSEYQNIGPTMIVGEESDWRFIEPVDIGVTMDADNNQRN